MNLRGSLILATSASEDLRGGRGLAPRGPSPLVVPRVIPFDIQQPLNLMADFEGTTHDWTVRISELLTPSTLLSASELRQGQTQLSELEDRVQDMLDHPQQGSSGAAGRASSRSARVSSLSARIAGRGSLVRDFSTLFERLDKVS